MFILITYVQCHPSVTIMLHVTIPLGTIVVPAMRASVVKEDLERVKVLLIFVHLRYHNIPLFFPLLLFVTTVPSFSL